MEKSALGLLVFAAVACTGATPTPQIVYLTPAGTALVTAPAATATSGPTASPAPTPIATETPLPTPEPTPEPTLAPLITDACVAELSSLYNAEIDLQGRLTVGINESNYSSRVGDIAAAYNALTLSALDYDCVKYVGVPLESAYNDYSTAAQKWNKCIVSFSCTNKSIQPTLRRLWSKADAQLAKARLYWP